LTSLLAAFLVMTSSLFIPRFVERTAHELRDEQASGDCGDRVRDPSGAAHAAARRRRSVLPGASRYPSSCTSNRHLGTSKLFGDVISFPASLTPPYPPLTARRQAPGERDHRVVRCRVATGRRRRLPVRIRLHSQLGRQEMGDCRRDVLQRVHPGARGLPGVHQTRVIPALQGGERVFGHR